MKELILIFACLVLNSMAFHAKAELRDLTPEEAAKARAAGYDPSKLKIDTNARQSSSNQANPTVASGSTTPPDLKDAAIWMDYFQGMTNAGLRGNVIEIKPEQLKFALGSQTFDYSGHFAIYLHTSRKHQTPYFGLGSAEKAKLVTLEDVGGQSMMFADDTILEKKTGFIDIETSGQEWIYSGPYEIQN